MSSRCLLCSLACTLDIDEGPEGLVVRGLEPTSVACAGGLSANGLALGERRLLQPLVRDDGALREASWDEALQRATDGLRKAVIEGGTGTVLVSGAPTLAAEEALAVRLLADSLGAVRSGSLSVAAGRASGPWSDKPWSTATWEDLDAAGAVLWVGDATGVEAAAIEGRLAAVRAKGVPVVVVTSSSDRFAGAATTALRVPAADVLPTVLGLLAGAPLSLAAAEGARLALTKAANPVVGVATLGNPDVSGQGLERLDEQVHRLSAANGARLLVTAEANARALTLVGLTTPGGFDRLYRAEATRAAWLVGDDAESFVASDHRPAFLVVQDLVLTASARAADVVLPMSHPLETGGTVVTPDGRVLRVEPCVEPCLDRTTLDVLTDAALRLRAGTPVIDPDDPAGHVDRVAGLAGLDRLPPRRRETRQAGTNGAALQSGTAPRPTLLAAVTSPPHPPSP